MCEIATILAIEVQQLLYTKGFYSELLLILAQEYPLMKVSLSATVHYSPLEQRLVPPDKSL